MGATVGKLREATCMSAVSETRWTDMQRVRRQERQEGVRSTNPSELVHLPTFLPSRTPELGCSVHPPADRRADFGHPAPSRWTSELGELWTGCRDPIWVHLSLTRELSR